MDKSSLDKQSRIKEERQNILDEFTNDVKRLVAQANLRTEPEWKGIQGGVLWTALDHRFAHRRDVETRPDFAQAGHHSSMTERSTSPDPVIQNRAENSCNISDITVPPGVSVDQNIRITEEKVKRMHVYAGMAGDQGGTAGLAAAALWFKEQVRNAAGRVDDVRSGRSWDYKQLGPQFQNFGNFNYGATGAATGLFNDKTLFEQAGKAQIAAGTSKPEWKGPPLYGDDPQDHDMIKRGIEYFKAGCHKRGR